MHRLSGSAHRYPYVRWHCRYVLWLIPAEEGAWSQRKPLMSANSKRTAPAAFYAGIIVALVVAGSLSLFPLWLGMCRLWATDPLRSIGAIFPPVACIGVLAAWHRIDWEINGRLWALLLIALSILLAKITTNSTIAINFHEHLLVVLHPGLILFSLWRWLSAALWWNSPAACLDPPPMSSPVHQPSPLFLQLAGRSAATVFIGEYISCLCSPHWSSTNRE